MRIRNYAVHLKVICLIFRTKVVFMGRMQKCEWNLYINKIDKIVLIVYIRL